MILIYHFVTVIDALLCALVAVIIYRRNRYQHVGSWLGLAFFSYALWFFGFAQYYRPMDMVSASRWAQYTLFTSLLTQPILFHALLDLSGYTRRLRWLVGVLYGWGGLLLVGVVMGWLAGPVRTDLPHMNHYLSYNRAWYPLVAMYYLVCQFLGGGVVAYAARHEVGYKRVQLVYCVIVLFVACLTTNSTILPLEYGFSIPPIGLFLMPVNLVLFGYVFSRIRLAEFNVVIARVLLFSITLAVVVGFSLLFIAAMTLVAPGFMGMPQILFTLILVLAISMVLAAGLPRLMPQAERLVQERLPGNAFRYQSAVALMAKELSYLPTTEKLLAKVATTLHSQMDVSRVLILLQDPVAGDFELEAQSGLSERADSSQLDLPEKTRLARQILETRETIVKDELPKRVPPALQSELASDLARLGVVVCVPMVLEKRVVGMICVGEKMNRNMFSSSDLELLESLSTEVAFAVRYRLMEDEMARKNKLVELGTIAAGVAHEIKNPLSSIRTFAQLLPYQMDDPEFRTEFSETMQNDVARITKVVDTMLTFARPAKVCVGDHLAAGLVEEATLLVQSRLKNKRIQLHSTVREPLMLKVDRQQIIQVLVNLLNNAIDVLPEEGRISIAIGAERSNHGEATQPGDIAVIEVSDNGPGMSSKVLARVFNPFFTTKKGGTGLGLSISQKLVRDHGGLITVSSVEGKGSTFQIKLPLKVGTEIFLSQEFRLLAEDDLVGGAVAGES